jgi:hypothetical protein
MHNRSSADKTNTGNYSCCHPTHVSGKTKSKERSHGKQGGTKADKDMSPEAGWLICFLPLVTNGCPQAGCQQETKDHLKLN